MLKLAVIGDPISHSLSPPIHKEILSKIGIDCEYIAVHVKKGELAEWMERAVKEGFNGFNATMPHKVDILEFMHEIDPEAKRCNSVNTVVIRNGKLYGHSTDGGGFLMTLRERGISVVGKNVLIAGKGGVASVLISTAQAEGAKSVTALGRKELANIPELAYQTDLFINATPLGMHDCDEDWVNLDFISNFPKSAVIYDTIYNPLQTKLLAKAKDRGLLTINGLDMLVCQAALADEFFLEYNSII